MDPRAAIDLLPEAARATSAVVERVTPGAWSNPSPCAGWSVRDVLNHLTSEHRWAPHLLRGETLEQVGSRYDGDLLRDDPVGAWRRAVAGSMLAFGAADVNGTVHTTAGKLTTGEYAQQMLLDLTVHGWDLAQGAGAAYAPDPDAVETVWAYARPRRDLWASSPVFDHPVATASSDRLDQLVALLGRDPAWGQGDTSRRA